MQSIENQKLRNRCSLTPPRGGVSGYISSDAGRPRHSVPLHSVPLHSVPHYCSIQFRSILLDAILFDFVSQLVPSSVSSCSEREVVPVRNSVVDSVRIPRELLKCLHSLRRCASSLRVNVGYLTYRHSSRFAVSGPIVAADAGPAWNYRRHRKRSVQETEVLRLRF